MRQKLLRLHKRSTRVQGCVEANKDAGTVGSQDGGGRRSVGTDHQTERGADVHGSRLNSSH